ncbi:MAG: GLUG motif-containing protein [Rhizomicrobium sp.]
MKRRLARTTTNRTPPLPAGTVLTYGPRWRHLRTALLACTGLCTVVAVPAHALPTGGTIVQGSGNITQTGSTALNITQTSPKLVIDWNSFNIAAGETVLFVQPDQLMQVLNRVSGSAASVILGKLNANGTVIIVNPNGILFGATADVNVKAIIATTTGISNANFMAGNLVFDQTSSSSTASVENRGTITAKDAGLVGLVAPGVENSGVITARLGKVTLAASNSFSVDLYGDQLINLVVSDTISQAVTTPDGQSLKALVSNSGTISADGGTIMLTANAARNILTTVVNMDGVLQARTVTTQNGKIVLDGGATGTVAVAGTADTTGTNRGEHGGAITLTGNNIVVIDGAKLLASGDAGGGAVTVGGWSSGTVSVGTGATIDASATGNGNGGTVSVIGGSVATMLGTILAWGGAEGGNGGTIETSGSTLNVSGSTVDASAPRGNTGSWLLDPYDLTVDTAAATSIDTALNSGTSVTLTTDASSATTAYGGVTSTSGNGDITIASAISWTSAATLSLSAYRSVNVDANITGSHLSVTYNTGSTTGNFYVSGAAVSLSSSLSINSTAYTLISSLSSLPASAAGYYALTSDIAAGTYSSAVVTSLSGTIEGLGHTISGLTISAPTTSNVGMVGSVTATGVIRNLILTNTTVTATGKNSVGAMVGINNGTLTNNTVTTPTVTGASFVGGLVGYNGGSMVSNTVTNGTVSGTSTVGGMVGYNHGTFSSGSSSGTVTASSYVGGLVGYNYAGSLTLGSASGVVRGSTYVGGLVGYNNSAISSGTSSVSVTGNSYVGGLAGRNTSRIGDSTATGDVSGVTSVGGLVGDNNAYGTISTSYATGNVTGTTDVGGLVGSNYAASSVYKVITSTASGSVSGLTNVGGLVGYNGGTVSASAASGTVNGGTAVGGLVGLNFGILATSNFTGTVSGAATVGGLVGQLSGASAVMLSNTMTGTVLGDSIVGGLIGENDTSISGLLYSTGSVSGAATVGGLVGLNTGTASGTVSGNVSGGTVVGGLVGYNSGTVSASSFTGTITGVSIVGGLVGQLNGVGAALVASTMNGTVLGSTIVGGLIGENDTSISGLIYNTGSVSGTATVGGLVGLNTGTVTAGTSSGTVTGTNAVGGLVGTNSGVVTASCATGTVSGTATVGGLVAINSGIVSSSYATGTVSGVVVLGGLAGMNTGTIADSYAHGAVTSTSTTSGTIGGLVGYNNGTNASVLSSYATGAVNGMERSGGLIGINSGTVSSSYATGSVTRIGTSYYTGGLIGLNDGGLITASYATGNVYGNVAAGGLIGWNSGGRILASYASGTVEGGDNFGGLVGWNANAGVISSSYASGAVYGGANAGGGLVGANDTGSSVISSYAIGSVATGSLGGLVGLNNGIVATSYWDVDTSGHSSGCATGSGTCSASGLTDAQMKNSSNYVGWDFTSTWFSAFSVNSGYPILRASPYVLTIAASAVTATYGDTIGAAGISYSNLWHTDTTAVVSGLSSSINATQGSSVGTYTTTLSAATATSTTGTSYTILYDNGAVVITPRTVSYSVGTATGTYGTAVAASVNWSNVYGSDDVGAIITLGSAAGSYALTSATNAGTYTQAITALSNGNYAIATSGNVDGSLTILPKTLTWSVANVTGTYGTAVSAGAATLSCIVNSDTVNATVTPSTVLSVTTNAGTYSAAVSAIDNANYTLAISGNTTGTVTILPKELTWTVANVTGTYGTAVSAGAATLYGIVNSDTVSATVSVSTTLAATTNAGSYTEAVSAINNSNYALAVTGNTTGTVTIQPKELTWSVVNVTGIYGTAVSAGAATLYGIVNSDTVNATVLVSTALSATTNAGSYNAAVSAIDNANYTLAASGNTTGTVTILPKALTWAVANVTGTYGTAVSAGAATLYGIVNSDTVNATVSVSTALSATTNAGSYSAAVSAIGNANYTLAASGNTTGTVTILPKELTWAVANVTGTYGTAVSAGAATLYGIVNGDTVNATVSVSTTLAATTNAGSYTEAVSAIDNSNYTLGSGIAGTITIASASGDGVSGGGTTSPGVSIPQVVTNAATVLSSDIYQQTTTLLAQHASYTGASTSIHCNVKPASTSAPLAAFEQSFNQVDCTTAASGSSQ